MAAVSCLSSRVPDALPSSSPWPRPPCGNSPTRRKEKKSQRPWMSLRTYEDSDMNRIPAPFFRAALVMFPIVLCSPASIAQLADESSHSRAPSATDAELNRHLDELTSKLDSMRQQLIESQNEMDELRNELRSLRQQLADRDRRIRPRAT